MTKRCTEFGRISKTRRAMLRWGVVASASAVLPALLFSGPAFASGVSDGHDVTLAPLIQSLRATGKSVCLSAADRLAASGTNRFDLHLRSAGLSEQDALNLATAMHGLPGQEGPTMRSFSVSYNPGMKDTGAKALMAALPTSVTEIGMVGCGLGDASGRAVLNLADRSRALRMICVEGNDFSARMRAEISDMGGKRSGLFVVV